LPDHRDGDSVAKVIATSLRLQRGLGDQPAGIGRNLAEAYLLAGWLRYLQGEGLSLARMMSF
jgi:hypothetical protein